MNFWSRLLAKGRKVTDSTQPEGPKRLLIREGDLWYSFLVFIPILLAIVATVALLLLQQFNVLTPDWLSLAFLIDGIVFAAGVLSAIQVKRAPPDSLMARMFLFGYTLHTNCPVWVPFFTKWVIFPGSQETFRTPEDPKDSQALIVALKQGSSVGTTGKNYNQLVVLQLVYRLSIWSAPWAVIVAFFKEFTPKMKSWWRLWDRESIEEAQRRAIEQKVQADIKSIVIAEADAPLQRFSVEDLLSGVQAANDEIMQKLAPKLEKIGVTLVSVAVEDVQDVDPDGYIFLLRQAIMSENASNQRVRTAAAELTARTNEAENDKGSRERELERDLQVATWQEGVLNQELVNAKVAAKSDVQPRVERLAIYGGVPVAEAQMLDLADRLTGDQVVDATGNAARLAGIHTEGGSVVLMGGGEGNDSGTALARTVMPLGALAALVPGLANKMGVQDPTQTGAGTTGSQSNNPASPTPGGTP